MQEFDCPSCQATLLVRKNGDSCPFCGEDISQFTARSSIASQGNQSPPRAEDDVPQDGFFDGTQLQDDGFLKIVRQSPSQAVIEILPGGPRSKGMMFFAFLWNVVVLGFLLVILFSEQNDGELWVPLAFISLFVLVGMFLGWLALRMTFMKTFILLETNRLAVQTTLFGRKKTRQFEIDETSRATLEVAYEQNEQPVYRVDVAASNGTAKLGTALSLREKQWLKQGINRFIRGESNQTVSAEDMESDLDLVPDGVGAGKVVGETAAVMSPNEVDSAIVRVDRDNGEDLWFSWKFMPPGTARTVITGVLTAITAIFLLIAGATSIGSFVQGIQKGDVFSVLFSIPFLLFGMMPLLMLIAVRRGRTSVRMDAESIKLSIGWWILRFSRSFALEDVRDVVIADPDRSELVSVSSGNRRSAKSVRYIAPGCVLRISDVGSPIPLTVGYDQSTAQQAGGLIHYQIERMGFQLSPTPPDTDPGS